MSPACHESELPTEAPVGGDALSQGGDEARARGGGGGGEARGGPRSSALSGDRKSVV